MIDILDVPESDLTPLGNKDVDELRGRIQEALIETEPHMVESVFDQWRVARDQLMRAKDLLDKAIIRVGPELTTYFMSLEHAALSSDGNVVLSIGDISDAVNDLTHFVIEGTENLAAKRTKRGSKRSHGTSIVRVSQREEYVGQQTIKLLPDGRQEIKTLIEFMDAGGGHRVPRFIIETKPAQSDILLGNTNAEVITETVEKEISPKIQRPSLEEKI